MVKEPRAGRVKTRLGRDIGMAAAAAWFRSESAALLRRVRDPRWRVVLAVSPDIQAQHRQIWPADLPRIPQGPGDLGRRMARAMGQFRGPVCLIGADIPQLSRGHIARAFAALRGHDAVFGPATDGGFWLVGLRRGGLARPRMFDGVRWSTPDTLTESRAALGHLRICLADRLSDVDTAEDLRALRKRDFCR